MIGSEKNEREMKDFKKNGYSRKGLKRKKGIKREYEKENRKNWSTYCSIYILWREIERE
jgi:hypothetical protein